MLDINSLTLGQIKEIQSIVIGDKINSVESVISSSSDGLSTMIGQKCIVRTQSAGVWFGTIIEKSGAEVIIKDARRMWRWHAAESISLSAVANHGIKHGQSKIAEAVPAVWLEAIELIPCSAKSIKSIEGAENAKAE